MCDKVSPDLKFVEREQEVLSFWDQEEIFKKALHSAKAALFLLFMTDRQRQTVNPI